MDNTTLSWYGKVVSDTDKESLTAAAKTVYVDKQNYENCHKFLLSKGFSLTYEGYQLTGNNDLYQYRYIR